MAAEKAPGGFFLRILLAVCIIFLLTTTAIQAQAAEDTEADWLNDITGEIDVDNVRLVENLEEVSLPILHLKNYLDGLLPELKEPGIYRAQTATREEGLFIIEEIEQEDMQFEEQPESWEEGDEWVWEIHDDDRFVEIILTAEIIDTVESPGRPLMSRIVFDLEYAAPQLTMAGSVRIRDDFDDIDMILDVNNRNLSFENYTAEINLDLLERAENELVFEGSLDYPGVDSKGTHRFLFTERPRDLPRTQPLYLDEYIFRGFFNTDKFALEGDMWICTESIVMNGYSVIN